MSNRKFGRNSTALDVVKGIDLTGKTVLITGTTSGIGTAYIVLFVKWWCFNFCIILLSRFGDGESAGLSQRTCNHGQFRIC